MHQTWWSFSLSSLLKNNSLLVPHKVAERGSVSQGRRSQEAMFSCMSPERRVPADRLLPGVREPVDAILEEMSPRFARRIRR